MNLISKLIKRQCQTEYEKELARQTYTLEQWKKAQQKFILTKPYKQAAVLYGDYMLQESGSDTAVPVFLPDFSPHRWDYEDYLGQAVYVRQDYYEQISWEATSRRSGLKKIIELAKADGMACPVVHARALLEGELPGFTKLETLPTRGCFEQKDEEALLNAQKAGVSVIIPSRDHPEMLRKCVQSLIKTTDQPLELIIVDNGSCIEAKVQVEALCRFTGEQTKGRISCRYIYEPMDFHFSKMCNKGVEASNGQYILLLNDDVEAVRSGWLETMLYQATKPYTGAVGIKLLYPEGERIQHTGIVNLPMGPVHKLQFCQDNGSYYDNRNKGVHNVCAVTGACLMMNRDLYTGLGGMSLELPVAFNDVELCFHAMEEGYYNVICCDNYLLHHESISRGQDSTEEKRSRLLRERSRLYEMHPAQSSFDPYYPYDTVTRYGLCHSYLDTAIRPAYQEGLPRIQVVSALTDCTVEKEHKALFQKAEHQRLNACLKFEVEQLYQEEPEYIHIAGYGFVIGSDNCSFKKTLVLKGENSLYTIPLLPVRRVDLEQNMPDQESVGLAGFHVKLPVTLLKKGRYKVELYVKDRASSLRLRQSSNLCMNINERD